jgi:hydrogenase nickel incorporation protein HypA/HybF
VYENTIVQALVEHVEAEARNHGATGVRRLSIRIGQLSGVVPQVLRSAYDTYRDKTMCEHAPLDIELVAPRWICPSCGSPLRRGDVLNCPKCEIPARLIEGDEVLLERMELEVS